MISATNSWMHSQNSAGRVLLDDERESGLVCTFTALVLKSRSAHLFHVGDGRIARIASDGVEELTTPHRVSLGGGESYLGRALGINRHVEIDYRQTALQPGDLFMLSTDGVHDHLTAGETCRIVEGAESLDQAARELAEAAMANGSRDNLKELVQEKFGDGIMSAIDFDVAIDRFAHEKATG